MALTVDSWDWLAEASSLQSTMNSLSAGRCPSRTPALWLVKCGNSAQNWLENTSEPSKTMTEFSTQRGAMKTAKFKGRMIDAAEGVDIKESRGEKPDFRCAVCGGPASLERAGGHTPDRFKHGFFPWPAFGCAWDLVYSWRAQRSESHTSSATPGESRHRHMPEEMHLLWVAPPAPAVHVRRTFPRDMSWGKDYCGS